MEKGQINWAEMRSNLYHIHDLLEQLRSQRLFQSFRDRVRFAGNKREFNRSPRAEKRPVTLEDLKLNALPESLPLLLILDGQIEEDNLASAGSHPPVASGRTPKTRGHRSAHRFNCDARHPRPLLLSDQTNGEREKLGMKVFTGVIILFISFFYSRLVYGSDHRPTSRRDPHGTGKAGYLR